MEHQEKQEDNFDDFVAKQQAQFDKQGTSESQEAVFSSMKRKFKAFLSKIGESSMDPDDSSKEEQSSNNDVNKADDTSKDEDGSAVSEDDGSGAPDQMDVPTTPEEAEALNPALLDDTDAELGESDTVEETLVDTTGVALSPAKTAKYHADEQAPVAFDFVQNSAGVDSAQKADMSKMSKAQKSKAMLKRLSNLFNTYTENLPDGDEDSAP